MRDDPYADRSTSNSRPYAAVAEVVFAYHLEPVHRRALAQHVRECGVRRPTPRRGPGSRGLCRNSLGLKRKNARLSNGQPASWRNSDTGRRGYRPLRCTMTSAAGVPALFAGAGAAPPFALQELLPPAADGSAAPAAWSFPRHTRPSNRSAFP